jgi:hypothetical protein
MATRTTYERAHIEQQQAADAPAAMASFPGVARSERQQARRSRTPLILRWRLIPEGMIGCWEKASAGEKMDLALERVSA